MTSRIGFFAFLHAFVLISGCKDDGGGGGGGDPVIEEASAFGCEAPNPSTRATCSSLCNKFSRCLQALCVNETDEVLFCDELVYEGFFESCLDDCEDETLTSAEDCIVRESCEAVFLDLACDPTAEYSCG